MSNHEWPNSPKVSKVDKTSKYLIFESAGLLLQALGIHSDEGGHDDHGSGIVIEGNSSLIFNYTLY